MNKGLTSALVLVTLVIARESAAQVGQAWTDRAYVNINAGFESASADFSDSVTFRLYDETANLSTAQSIDSGAFFDFSAGARVWRNFSAGIGFHEGNTFSQAAVTGMVPHPLFFDRARAVSESVGDLERAERAVHVQFGYLLPIRDRYTVHFMIGPSFFKVRQEVVSDASLAEQGGTFTSVTATPVISERESTPTGVNVGLDFGYKVYERRGAKVGAGLFLRYAGATARIQLLNTTVDSKVGGFQVGIGGRLRF